MYFGAFRYPQAHQNRPWGCVCGTFFLSSLLTFRTFFHQIRTFFRIGTFVLRCYLIVPYIWRSYPHSFPQSSICPDSCGCRFVGSIPFLLALPSSFLPSFLLLSLVSWQRLTRSARANCDIRGGSVVKHN